MSIKVCAETEGRNEMARTSELMRRAQRIALEASERRTDSTRRKCFVSYHVADIDEVDTFLGAFGEVFIPRCIGVTEEDDFVDSDDADYIKRRIREKYLTDSTVTILLLGSCTWARRFVDWELSSSLRNDPVNKRNGVLAMPLPSMKNSAKLPDRVRDNWTADDSQGSYVSYHSYPASRDSLRRSIESAFSARTAKAHLVDNSRSLRMRNASC